MCSKFEPDVSILLEQSRRGLEMQVARILWLRSNRARSDVPNERMALSYLNSICEKYVHQYAN